MAAGRKVAVLIVAKNRVLYCTALFLVGFIRQAVRGELRSRYSLCKCIGFTFAQDVVGAVDISTDLASIVTTQIA
jgi:hypothetical protein